MSRRSAKKERPLVPSGGPSGPITLITRISIEAVVIGAMMLGLFHWAYRSAPLPATLTAIVAIILAVAIDHVWFGSRRDRKA
jgi:hypothetical protein